MDRSRTSRIGSLRKRSVGPTSSNLPISKRSNCLSREINYGGPGKITAGDPGLNCRRFEGRVALLTGAARGIGFASAVRLPGEGAEVVITDRNAAALDEAIAVAFLAREDSKFITGILLDLNGGQAMT